MNFGNKIKAFFKCMLPIHVKKVHKLLKAKSI